MGASSVIDDHSLKDHRRWADDADMTCDTGAVHNKITSPPIDYNIL